MKREVEKTKRSLIQSMLSVISAHKQHDCAHRQVHRTREKLETTIAEHVHLEDENNSELSEVVGTLQKVVCM